MLLLLLLSLPPDRPLDGCDEGTAAAAAAAEGWALLLTWSAPLMLVGRPGPALEVLLLLMALFLWG
jgi:hypothetical protein